MPTQSIAATTAKQHSHITTPDASASPRRPLLEAWVIAGGVGMIANAAIVCLQGTVLASGLTVVERVFGWLLAAWSASILAQSVITLQQSRRTDRYWQRIGALGLLLVNGVLFIVGWFSGGVLHTPCRISS